MPSLRDAGFAPLIRTDFSNEDAWNRALAGTTEYPDEEPYCLEYLGVVNSRELENVSTNGLIQVVDDTPGFAPLVYIADHRTMVASPRVC
ncbi:DUF6924 domain-containing protein [Rhodococcus rhodnii]|uniref:DUF6924 domain-containing protein n=1 Tax=Rhodococcus rhodnii TaxID=38312 RepID=UPI0035308F55